MLRLLRFFYVSFCPPQANTHDWRLFITPRELESACRSAGLIPSDTSQWQGIEPVPAVSAAALTAAITQRSMAPLFATFAASNASTLGYGGLLSASYMGFAVKPLD